MCRLTSLFYVSQHSNFRSTVTAYKDETGVERSNLHYHEQFIGVHEINSLKYNDCLTVFWSASYLHALESCFLISLHMCVYQMAVNYVQRSKLPTADVECVRWHSGTLPSSPSALFFRSIKFLLNQTDYTCD